MKLKVLGTNKTELSISTNTVVFFSYNQPVAAQVDGKLYRTSKHWSNTTSRHINEWLGGYKATSMPQEFFDNLI